MPINDIRTYIDYCMIGPATIAKREALLTTHRAQVMTKLAEIQENLKGIDEKLSVYTSPDAVKTIEQQRVYSSLEKEHYALDNPYKNQ